MRVPVRRLPETRVSEQQQGFGRPVAPLDVAPLTSVIEGFRNQLLDEQDDRQRVELTRRLLQETNELQADFAAQQRDPEQSPIGFADRINTTYTERHAALREQLRGEGYSEDLLDEFDGRLGTVRQGFFERGLGHQLVQLRSRALEEIENIAKAGSQYAATDPINGFTTAREMLEEAVRTQPDLTEEERAAALDTGMAIIRDGGARSLAIQHPDEVIRLLDPQGFTAPRSQQPAAGGATINTENLDAARASVASVLSSGGLSPQVVAGFLGNFDIEGGYGGDLGDRDTASGIAQWREERRANFIQRFGKEPHQATPQEQAQFVLWELENPVAAGMTAEQVAEIRNARTAEEAAELIDEYYERSSGEHRAQRIRAASGYAAAAPARVETAEVGTVPVPAGTGAQQSDFGEVPTSQTDIANIRTGNALLDDLNGPERMQILIQARERLNQRTASQRAEMDVRIGNFTAETMQNGEAVTPMPTEAEVLAAYPGPEGPQRWAQLQQTARVGPAIRSFRTQSEADIQRTLNSLLPTPGSPTYETQLQIYNAAETAANRLREARQQDAAGYALQHFPAVQQALEHGTTANYYAELDRAYEQLGINPEDAPVMSAQMAARVTERYRTMTPDQKRAFMVQHMGEMGEDRFFRFVRDMEGTTAETDARIFDLFRGYSGPAGQVANLYHQVLEGREIIAQDPAKRPRAEQVLTLNREFLLPAIRNLETETSRAIQEAVEGLYAQRGGDPVNIDRSIYRQALAEVLGGSLPVNMGHGTGYHTILPPRTTPQQFESWIESQTTTSLTRSSVTGREIPRYGDQTPARMSDIIDEGVFVMIAPGQYIIRMASDGRALGTSSGNAFIVNIDPRAVRQSAPRPQRAPLNPLRGTVM